MTDQRASDVVVFESSNGTIWRDKYGFLKTTEKGWLSPPPFSRDMITEIESLRSELAALRERADSWPQWQPIETAPKDGTSVLVCSGQIVGEAAYRSEDEYPAWWWAGTSPDDYCGDMIDPQPHIWMPLPAPPPEATPDA